MLLRMNRYILININHIHFIFVKCPDVHDATLALENFNRQDTCPLGPL